MKCVVILHFVAIFSTCNGNISQIMTFLNDIAFHQLDFVNYTSIEFVDENVYDEIISVEEIDSLNVFLSFNEKLKVSDPNDCNAKTLSVVSLHSPLLNKNQSCKFQGDFIQNSCQMFLIFAYTEVMIDENFYQQLKFNLVHQPFVFLFMPKNHTNNYELLEIQVPMKKFVKLISWFGSEHPR